MDEWIRNPLTIQYRKALNKRIEDISQENPLVLDSIDATALGTALRVGKIKALQTVIEDLREGFGET